MVKSRWNVEELAFIGLFSFSQFIMWNDIRNRSEDLKKNKIVSSLLSGKIEWVDEEGFPAPEGLDEAFAPIDVAVPISADSSQLSAICAAGKGNSFVLHGPPGTGKSQTITNIIANTLFQGKTVLFIAEKMAALSVVQKRLESIGLAPFCLELHSNKAKKKDVLDQLEQCVNIGKIKSSEEQISEVTPEIYNQWVDIIKQLKVAGNECGSAYNNPLKEFTNSSYSLNLKGEISENLKNYSILIDKIQGLISNIDNLIGINDIAAYNKVYSAVKLINLIRNAAFIPLKLFQTNEIKLLKEKVDKVCMCGKKRDEVEKKLLSLFNEAILTYDNVGAVNQWNQAEASWFLPKILGENKVIKSLKILANNPKHFDRKEVISYLKLIKEYKANLEVINENNNLFSDLFGLVFNNGKADWDKIQEIYEITAELDKLISEISSNESEKQAIKLKLSNEVISDLSGFNQNNNVFQYNIDLMDTLANLENILSQKAGINFNILKKDKNWLSTIEIKTYLWLQKLDGLRNWCTYLNIKNEAKKNGLKNVINAYESGLITEDSLLPSFYQGVSLAFAIHVVDNEKCLSEFNGAIFEENILKYKQTCEKFESLTRKELVASQMPTCEAVGAIARGNNVIVVGDPKQVPPTSFFNTNRVDEENYEKEDLESILDDCLALSMPEEHLQWHYRSRHESLIAFSNMQYYDNKLFTFPSPNDLVSAVKFIPVEGYYDRGKTKQNRAEAKAIVNEILRRLSDPILSKQSIGVVTFSSVQQNLIDDLLVEAFSKNQEVEKINNKAYEPIFIKNLENVQGDERDIILFSVGYGPDIEGKVAFNFGPLNREGGWRRLNVAVSRARKEMIVYSTLKPEQIDLSRTRSEGIAGLKAFLAFAKNGKNTLPIKVSNISKESDIAEKLIAEKIRTLGYEVNTNIGCSEYKIDIGIVNPNKKDEYILGIMCDGSKYRAANTARDRNILQGEVLKSLGWRVYRLWILDWWENSNKELTKIDSAVKKALEKPKADIIETSTIQVPNFKSFEEASTDTIIDENIKYSICTLESVILGTEEFYLPKNNKVIIEQIEKVLEAEAPISKNLLCKRILSAWNISRMGSRLDRRFEELFYIIKLTKTNSNKFIANRFNQGDLQAIWFFKRQFCY